jgi:hypothetical protein
MTEIETTQLKWFYDNWKDKEITPMLVYEAAKELELYDLSCRDAWAYQRSIECINQYYRELKDKEFYDGNSEKIFTKQLFVNKSNKIKKDK